MRYILLSLVLLACGGGRRASQTGYVGGDAPTTLTPDPPPLCGDFGRPYIAPESTGQTQPATPPPGLGTLNAIQSRIAREGEGFELYAEADQELIRNGRARVGLDERAAYLAHGLPAFYWNVSIDEQPCRVMMYGVLGNEEVDTTVYTCNGLVTHIAPAEPRLPCWRLSEVAPRAIERAPHFDGAGIERQWEILHGLLARGQSMDDVYIGFGDPFRAGMEAREDGTNADQHVYLDSTGDAYALYLTFVTRELRGWRFPPDRQLTPQAQQRRLDAMEQRMMDQLREMEQASIARHQAEMSRMNTIQENQQQIRADIANTRASIIDAVAEQGEMTRGTVVSQGEITRGAVRNQQAQQRQREEAERRQEQSNNSGRVRQTPPTTRNDRNQGQNQGGQTQTRPPTRSTRPADTGEIRSVRQGNTIYTGRDGLGMQCQTQNDCPERYLCSRRNKCLPDQSWITAELGPRRRRYRNTLTRGAIGPICGLISAGEQPRVCEPGFSCLVQGGMDRMPIVGNCIHNSARELFPSSNPVGRGSEWFLPGDGRFNQN